MHQFFKNYEFELNEINCLCEGCKTLNLLEAREIKMLEDEIEEKNEKEMALLNERSREIASLRRAIDSQQEALEVQAQKIQQVRNQIENFGKKKLSDLTFIKG